MVARECRVVLLGQRFPLVIVFGPARARSRPAARMWFQHLKLSIQTLDVPSCLLRIYHGGARSRWSLVVLRSRGSLQRIHERSVCAGVNVIRRPACCVGHFVACFVLRLLAKAAPRRGTAGVSTCAPRARHRCFRRLRGCGHALLDCSVGQFPRVRGCLSGVLLEMFSFGGIFCAVAADSPGNSNVPRLQSSSQSSMARCGQSPTSRPKVACRLRT